MNVHEVYDQNYLFCLRELTLQKMLDNREKDIRKLRDIKNRTS